MARGKRRPPMQPSAVAPANGMNSRDEVDDFVAKRHKVMLEKTRPEESDSDDLGSEPEVHERSVLNIDMSDSDSDGSGSRSSEDDEDGLGDREERKGWGGKKRLWYGGDTHEYEIMEDEEREEALKDEEEEALRMQNEALAAMRPEDFRDEEDDDTDAGDDDDDDNAGDESPVAPRNEIAADVLSAAAPEVPLLIREMLEGRRQANIWKERVHWNEVARIIYHLHASFVNNVAFYLCLRTDPDSEGVDIRTHPVLVQIVRIRSLLQEAMALPCEEPSPKGARVQIVRIRPLLKKAMALPCEAPSPKDAHVAANPASKPQEIVEPMRATDQRVEIADNTDDVTESRNADMQEVKSKKRKKGRKRTKVTSDDAQALATDEERIRALLPSQSGDAGDDEDGEERRHEQKRRKLNQLVGAMERERKNSGTKRLASADADVVRSEPNTKNEIDFVPLNSDRYARMGAEEMDDDDEVMRKMLVKKAKKEARKARKATESEPHVYTFNDDVDPESRRRASSQVVKNRGLTRYRPKDKKTPRTKNRLAYSKAVVRRKGAVRDYTGTPGSNYSGEASGINMAARKGSKLSNV